MDEIEALKRRARRERLAREEAEKLLEIHSRQLQLANRRLERLAKSLEEEVGQKSYELLSAQRVAGFGTMVWDIEAELITWSDGVYLVLGLDPELDDLSFEKYVAAIHEADRMEFVRTVEAARGQGFRIGEVFSTEHRIVRPDGKIRWLQLHGEIAGGYNAQGLMLFGAIQDITEKKTSDLAVRHSSEVIRQRVKELETTQKQLAAARDEAEAANRAKSRFLALMSHEIRTPMNGVLGALTLLKDTGLLENQAKLVDVASNSAETLRSVLNDVIDLSRLEKGGEFLLETVTFDLPELVREISEFWRPLAESKGLAHILSKDDDLPRYVSGDPGRIRQVLNNMVSNAIKFTEVGHVELSVTIDGKRSHEPDEDVLVKIAVIDTGKGISHADQKKLFQEFSQVGNVRVGEIGGSGLGLAISRALTERMGGSVGVISSPESGSEFWCRIPLKFVEQPEDVADGTGASLAPLVARGSTPRVLLAEDVAANQLIAKLMIEGFGCRVDVVANGLEAIEALDSQPYDLVLMDVSMPELDGIAATRQIRSRPSSSSEIPIVGVTAFVFPQDVKECLDAGMNAVISKPIQRVELHSAIDKALRGVDADSTGTLRGEVLDTESLQILTRGFAGDQVVKLLGRVVIDLEDQAESLLNSADDGDLERLKQRCHALKGMALSFGCNRVGEVAKEAEFCFEDMDVEAAVSLIRSRLPAEIKSAVDALNGHLSGIT